MRQQVGHRDGALRPLPPILIWEMMDQKVLEVAHGQDLPSTAVHVQIPAARSYSRKGSSRLRDVQDATLLVMSF